MSISQGGSGQVVENAPGDGDQQARTSVVREDNFAIRARNDGFKQLLFNLSASAAQKKITIAAGANTDDIVITLPSSSTTLGAPIIPSSSIYLFDEFITGIPNADLGWGTAGNAGYTATNVTAQHPGVATVHTSSSTTGAGIFYLDTLILLGGGQITAEWLVRVSALSSVAQTYTARLGFGDTFDGTDYTNGAYLEYTDGTNDGNWVSKTANNGTRTSTNLSVGPTTTDWQKIKLVVAAAGASVEVQIDRVSVGTNTTNIPTAASRWVGPQMSILKSAGSTQRNLYADYFYYTQALTR